MASPYLYVAGGHSPYQQSSPFIPPANLLSSTSPYTSPYSSPYTGSNPLPGGSPHSPNVTLPGVPNTPLHTYDPYPPHSPWERPRRPSYHGPNPYEPGPNWLSAPPMGHHRSHSFGENTYPAPVGYGGYWPPPSTPFVGYPPQGYHIHPLLNGENPRGDFLFDLSAPKFSPLKYMGPGHVVPLSPDELQQAATWPTITRLRIICDLIPQWPIDIQFDPGYVGPHGTPPGYQPPPITLGDILVRIYEHLGQRITHMDWAGLSPQDETAIARAYTTRCKSLGSLEAVERSHGVKRIDYCSGKVWFRGLTRVGDGMDVLKLHLFKK